MTTEQPTLFNESKVKEVIRTIGFYQPFCTAMLHGKVETRWVQKGKKPPFPLGKYLMYSTKKRCSNSDLFNWCGPEIMSNLIDTVKKDKTGMLDGYAICTGRLAKMELLTQDHNPSFINFVGEKTIVKEGKELIYVQWALIFEDVHPIEPFIWQFGKQGVGFVPDSELHRLH